MPRARLILLNGPPGIGKSTLAERLATDHALALILDIDSIRRWLGRWEDESESKRLARGLAKEMARVHLLNGYDVVVPQLLTKDEFIFELRDVAECAHADFVEVAVLDSRAGALKRFKKRRAKLEVGATKHPEAAIEGGRETEAVNYAIDALLAMVRERPAIRVIETKDGEIDEAYAALRRALADEGRA